MDDFLKFNLVRVDAAGKIVSSEAVTERVDLIARQFRDFLHAPNADDQPHGILISNEFQLWRRVQEHSGKMSFLIDVGDGREAKLAEVAAMVFVRRWDESVEEARGFLGEYLDPKTLPEGPVAVVLEWTKDVPFIIREWYSKAAAGFFAHAR